MFDDFATAPKGKGKEKDVGKRRAYVRVITSLGGGALNLELYCEKARLVHHSYQCADVLISRQAPKTCYNFLQLAKQGKYNDCLFHRLVPGFMVHDISTCIPCTATYTPLCRCKPETLRAPAQAASHVGAPHSGTNLIHATRLSTIRGE